MQDQAATAMPNSLPTDNAQNIASALEMLNLFASVGADSFDITHTNIAEEKRGFRAAQTLDQARASMPHLVPSSVRRQNNVIVRPRAKAVALIQLDDLAAEDLPRIAPAAFLTLRTSAGGTQAWVAVENAPAGLAARLKTGLNADREASGAVRVAGTRNYKAKYAPNFPLVTILAAQPGHVLTPEALGAMHVLAPEPPRPPALPVVSDLARRTDKWPNYQRCLEGAPIGSSGGPKRTSADFTWCKIAISWGHGIEATAERLMLESTKAQENGEAYARQTAEHAEYAARQRNAQPRGPQRRL